MEKGETRKGERRSEREGKRWIRRKKVEEGKNEKIKISGYGEIKREIRVKQNK